MRRFFHSFVPVPRARFLYIVAIHSGYFTLGQFRAFTKTANGKRPTSFAQKRLKNSHATVRDYMRRGATEGTEFQLVQAAQAIGQIVVLNIVGPFRTLASDQLVQLLELGRICVRDGAETHFALSPINPLKALPGPCVR